MNKEKPTWGPIGQQVFERTYARTKPDGTTENWEETINRVVTGNLAFVDAKYHEKDEREKLFKLIYSMSMIPAGRHLSMCGVTGRSYLGNCHSAGFYEDDLTEHFIFTFTELMKGGGIGATFSNRYIDIYPPIVSAVDLHIVCDPSHPDYKECANYLSKKFNHNSPDRFIVQDSREGWSDALKKLLLAVWAGKSQIVVIDVSILRHRGAILRSFGGESSGPAPLVMMLSNIASIINSKLGQKLASLDVMRIDHEISKAVVAGSKRRSARMSIKSWKDKDIFDFIKCKQNPEAHWSTNISVEVDNDFFLALRKGEKRAKKILKAIAIGAHKNGEPGAANFSLANVGEIDPVYTLNPCGEIAFSMGDICMLGHVNLAKYANDDNAAKEAFRLMTRFLIRSTFGDITNKHQQQAISRNRRIGVGFFGYHNWLVYQGIRFSESHHNEKIKSKLESFKKVCRSEAQKYCFQLRIPESIKVTTIAPTGSISNLAGAVSGCQPVFAKYYIRRVRYGNTDPNLKALIDKGYPVEDSVYEPNTKIVSFYCKDQLVHEAEKQDIDPSIIEEQSDISLSDHMSTQAMLQAAYSDNAISYTLTFDPKKVKSIDIARMLKIHLPHLKGITLMPEGDSRPQMPLQRISREQYEEAEKKGLAMVSDAERECTTGCPIK